MEVIAIERFTKIDLRNFVLSIGDISVLFDFYIMDIGDKSEQKIIQYNLLMEQDNKVIADNHNHLTGELIDIELIKATNRIWFEINHRWTVNKLDMAFGIFGNVRMRIIAEYGDLEYFIYTDHWKDDNDYINHDDEDAMQIKIVKDTFHSLIQLGTKINNYCLSLLNEEI